MEIILVDNGSTDDSVAFVREVYPHVRVIEAGRNLGFAGGNNLGAREATGDYLALINNDARTDPRWLRALVEALEADLVVFDTELTAAQVRNLEKLFGVKVIDRAELILDIFSQHAERRLISWVR